MINSRNSKSLKINLKAPFTELFFCPNLKKLNKMSVVLFDPEFRSQLFPLAMTRSVADFRIGISTIKEKSPEEMSLLTSSNFNLLFNF